MDLSKILLIVRCKTFQRLLGCLRTFSKIYVENEMVLLCDSNVKLSFKYFKSAKMEAASV